MENTPLELAKLNRSLAGKLRAEAKRRGVDVGLIRKQYVFTIFLSRVFGGEETNWTLLGGNALLIRTGGGRFTQDIDMAREHQWGDLEEVRDELQQLADQSTGKDPFRFELYNIKAHSEPDRFGYGAETAKVQVRAHLGAVFDIFSIDLTTRRHIDGPVNLVRLRPIIEHPTLMDLPLVPTTPSENHLADKVCALYEKHGPNLDTPSTRYRDLADIVRLIQVAPLDGERLAVVLRREEKRRKMHLPLEMQVPGPAWLSGFPAAALTFAEYPTRFQELGSALAVAQRCLGPVLSGERTTGVWDPHTQKWLTELESVATPEAASL